MREPDREQFREFVAGRAAGLFRVALALTGGREAAEDMLQHALAQTCARWRSVKDNPGLCPPGDVPRPGEPVAPPGPAARGTGA